MCIFACLQNGCMMFCCFSGWAFETAAVPLEPRRRRRTRNIGQCDKLSCLLVGQRDNSKDMYIYVYRYMYMYISRHACEYVPRRLALACKRKISRSIVFTPLAGSPSARAPLCTLCDVKGSAVAGFSAYIPLLPLIALARNALGRPSRR